MIDLIQRIGPILGVVAFLGFAVLAFLIFQQAREVRRLREWAGRAPERAEEADEAAVAAAEARGEAVASEPGRGVRERAAEPLRAAWQRFDRNSPLDARYVVLLVAALVVAAGVVTSGFGVLDGDDARPGGGGPGEGRQQQEQRDRPEEVAVLNGTQVTGPDGITIQGVPGLADEVAEAVVRPATGFRPGRRDNAASGLEQTTIMFEPGAQRAANRLARAVAPTLGETPVEPMIQEVRDLAGGARLVIVVGHDDAGF